MNTPTVPTIRQSCAPRPVEMFERPLEETGDYAPRLYLGQKTEHREVRDSQAMLLIVLGVVGIVILFGVIFLSPLSGGAQ